MLFSSVFKRAVASKKLLTVGLLDEDDLIKQLIGSVATNRERWTVLILVFDVWKCS